MDQSPTGLFEAYAQDFNHLTSKLSALLASDGKTLTGEPLRSLLRKVASDLDESDELLSQLEVELPSIPNSVRPTYTTKFKGHKAQLDKLKRQLRETRNDSNRNELLSNPSLADQPYSDDPSPSGDYSQRTRLLRGTDQLADGSRRLEESHRLALETEEVGAGILSNLRGQREQIEHSRDVLTQADSSIDRASGTLKKMVWRMYQQKVVTYSIIAILVALIILIVWSKLSR